MQLRAPSLSTSSRTTSVVASVRSDTARFPDEEITIRVDDEVSPHDAAAMFVPPLVLLSAVIGEDLVIDATVSPALLAGARRAAALYGEWWGYRPPNIVASAIRAPGEASAGVGLWYTRGVDSSCTLVQSQRGTLVEGSVTRLLGLDWIDPPYGESASQRGIWADTEAAARDHGLPLVRFTTDLRRLLDRELIWDDAYGPVLAGLGLGSGLERVLLSSSIVGDPKPYGSHPRLDPLWRTEATSTMHVGNHLDRMAKVALIASDPQALRTLKVCWVTDTHRNCGRCQKCLQTMTCLACVGATGWGDLFEAPFSVDAVRALSVLPGAPFPVALPEVVAAIPEEHTELLGAWSEFLDRYRPARSARWRHAPRIALVADVGGHAGYHVGDEAMLAATVTLLRELVPDVELTVVSQDPRATAAGHRTLGVPWLGFGDDLDDQVRDARLATLEAEHAAETRPALTALLRTDALVVSGGGNLHRSWPHHIYERVALARAARAHGMPVLLVGQTIGPELGLYEHLVRELVRGASLVGVRESTSASVVAGLGADPARVHLQLDSAFALEGRQPTLPELGLDVTTDDWIAVTVHPFAPFADPLYGQLADELVRVASALDAPVLLLPHVAGEDSDVALHLADLLHGRVGVATVGVLPGPEMAWLTRHAALVVSTRYHPVVFGLSGGKPCVGMYVDAYTEAKVRGALDLVGLGAWALPLPEAAAGGISSAVAGLEEVSAHLSSLRPELDAWLSATQATVATRLAEAGIPVR